MYAQRLCYPPTGGQRCSHTPPHGQHEAGRATASTASEKPYPLLNYHPTILRSHQTLSTLTLMSHTHSAAPSSSNFQLIINNALKAYEKRTKKDLLAHPLATQLQTCATPAAILAMLQERVQGLDQSQRRDERWSKWLDPTVNVLFTFSATIEAGVSLVFCRACHSCEICVFTFIWQVFSPASVIFTGVGVLLSVCTLFNHLCVVSAWVCCSDLCLSGS